MKHVNLNIIFFLGKAGFFLAKCVMSVIIDHGIQVEEKVDPEVKLKKKLVEIHEMRTNFCMNNMLSKND